MAPETVQNLAHTARSYTTPSLPLSRFTAVYLNCHNNIIEPYERRSGESQEGLYLRTRGVRNQHFAMPCTSSPYKARRRGTRHTTFARRSMQMAECTPTALGFVPRVRQQMAISREVFSPLDKSESKRSL